MVEVVLFGTFFVLLFLSVPVAFALGLAAVATMVFVGGIDNLAVMPNVFYSSLSSATLLAIPFFILAGVIMEYAGISKRLIDLADACVGHRKHGLAMVVIIAAFFFSAISGSGPATVAAIGAILIPALVRNGYFKHHAAAMLASAGSMGIIIPPSITLIIFGVVASDYERVSIARLFMAGVIPGILMALALYIAARMIPRTQAARAPAPAAVGALDRSGGGSSGLSGGSGERLHPGEKEEIEKLAAHGAQQAGRAPLGDIAKRFVNAIPGLLVPVIILGGIYGGVFTPTESAVVAAFYALAVGLFFYREIKPGSLGKIFITSAVQSSVVMIIVGCASIFAYVITSERVAQHVSDAILGITDNRVVIMILVLVLLLIAGAFIDAISALFLFIPIFVPILLSLGYDITTIGVMMTVNLAIGLITPPVGVNLFVAAGIAKTPLTGVSKGAVPFLIAALTVLLLIAFIPGLSNWLPDLLGM
ncbi:TRAP transporter large permease [Arthrobacter castelli]|uniref:TRAP transporter large permease n=1 Tax=Arthrobacter castelli TaxID=271431 RepID=UPI00040189EA|nr:TRAP transporter large permease [Arthrobacter castelli]